MSFDLLARELDRWAKMRRVATLWWRDDDAVAATEPLARLADLASRHEVPVALAVVPAALDGSLPRAVGASSWATVLQHGFAHRNHAAPGQRSCELRSSRSLPDVERDLATGLETLRAAFGERFLPVMVPPWNRIDAAVIARLPALGFTGLSTFGARAAATPLPHLVQCNTHVDPIDWRGGRTFVGADAAAGRLASHLAARRAGTADASEPSGLLTHHLVFDAAAWRFVGDLLARTCRHPAARWIAAAAAFSGRAPSPGAA
jgi:hypothetical protein